MRTKYFILDSGDVRGTVDMVHLGASIDVRIEGKEIVIVARVTHGETEADRAASSSWDEQEIRMKVSP